MISHSKPCISDAECAALVEVLRGGMLSQGARVLAFERAFAARVETGSAVAVGSGTAALLLALQALELRKSSEVIAPTYVCSSVTQAICSAGLVPVLCDVGDDGNMTAESVRAVFTSRTCAIIAVHLFGTPCQISRLQTFQVPIIEDACQALGAIVEGRQAGSGGDIGVFSMHSTKCIATGEGGVAVTSDAKLAEALRQRRDGVNPLSHRLAAPLTDLQAAIGLSQLSRYSEFLDRRRMLADRYFERLRGAPLGLPTHVRDSSIFFRFPVRSRLNFTDVSVSFADRGVSVRRGVDSLLHREVCLPPEGFPNAEKRFAETVSLPLYPALTDGEQDQVLAACYSVWE